MTVPTAPKTTITASGDVLYEEVARPKITRLEKYVAEMAAGAKVAPNINVSFPVLLPPNRNIDLSYQLEKVHDQIADMYKLVKAQPSISKQHMSAIKALYSEVARSLGRQTVMPTGPSGGRARRPSSQFLRPQKIQEPVQIETDKVPLLHLRRKVGNEWEYSARLTSLFLDVLKDISTVGHPLLTPISADI